MFLDDKIIAIGKNTDITNINSVNKAQNEILNVCLNHVIQATKENSSNDYVGASLKRANNQFKNAIKKLEEDNIFILNENEFMNLYLEKKDLPEGAKELLKKYLK